MSSSVKVITTESEAGALQMFLVEDPDDQFNPDSPVKPADQISESDRNGLTLITDTDVCLEEKAEDEKNDISDVTDTNTHLEEKAEDEQTATLKLPEVEPTKNEPPASFDKPSRRSLRLKAGKKPLSYKINSDDDDMLDFDTHLSVLVSPKSSSPKKKSNSHQKQLACYICGLKCLTEANLKLHEKTHADIEKPFVCSHCSYACKRKSDLKKHEETHGPSNAYKCLECDYSGKRLKYLKKHMRIHNRESAFSCHICQYRCRSKSTFDKHLASHSKFDSQLVDGEDVKPHICVQCGECFEQKWALNKHLETHSDNSPFFCVVCGAAFKTKEFLRKHEAQHKPPKTSARKLAIKSEIDADFPVAVKEERHENSNSSSATIILENTYDFLEKPIKVENFNNSRMKGGPIPCPLCTYSCTTKNLLRRHMRRHSDVKPFVCTQCGAAFKRKDHLKVHKNTHNNARPHMCPHCNYGTHRKYRLKLHILTHQTVKPVSCPSCEYRCRRYCELKYHMKNKHKVEVDGDSEADQKLDDSGDLELKCDKCDYTCDSIKRLKYHMDRHDNKTPHSCPHCDYKCSSRSSLSDHLLRHAGLKPCLCSICGAAFRNTSRLNRHKLVHSDIKPYGCDFCDFSSRSKYNLKQHMLRHTDKERARRRRKPKLLPNLIDSPVINTTEIIKQSFHADIQPFISQLTSSAYLENISQQHDLSSIFSDQEPLKFTDHQLSLASQFFKSQLDINDTTIHREKLIELSGKSGLGCLGSTLQADHPGIYLDGYHQGNDLLGQNNSISYNPGAVGQANSNYNSTDKNGTGTYGFTSPYIYNETVFPGTMNANMNFYMNAGSADSFPLNSSSVNQNSAQNNVKMGHSGKIPKEAQCQPPLSSDIDNTKSLEDENNPQIGEVDDRAPSVDNLYSSSDIKREGHRPRLRTVNNKKSRNGEKPTHICVECGYITLTNTMLQRHRMTHMDLKPFKCEECDKAFKRRDHLKAHMRTHNSDKPFTCNLCSYTCSRKYRMTLHEKTHMGEIQFDCSVCETAYPTEEELREHVKIHQEGSMFLCDKCDFKCMDKDDLKSHSEAHKTYLCEQCSYVCRSSREFASHQKMHDEKEELTCTVCSYTCDSQKRLKYHMERHDNKTPLACPQCDYKCSSRSSLSDHLLRHEGLKPFLCTDCGMSFRNVSRLNRHKLTHTDIKPHSCDYCPFSSRSRYNLKQHMSRHFK